MLNLDVQSDFAVTLEKILFDSHQSYQPVSTLQDWYAFAIVLVTSSQVINKYCNGLNIFYTRNK